MRLLQAISRLLAAALLSSFSATSAPLLDSSSTVELTAENFNGIVDGSSAVLVAFVAPWCGHSRALAPVYDRVAAHFDHVLGEKASSKVIVARCDATRVPDIASRQGITGYPTIRYFPKGQTSSEPVPLSDLTAAEIVAWLANRAFAQDENESFSLRDRLIQSYRDPRPLALPLTTSTFESFVYDEERTGKCGGAGA